MKHEIAEPNSFQRQRMSSDYRPLILTNSMDGTADVLSRIFSEAGRPFFRWNVDLWKDYEIEFDGSDFRIADPTGREISTAGTQTTLIWRKPFIELMDFGDATLGSPDQGHAQSQIRHCLLALVANMRDKKLLKLVEPYADRRLPKLFQVREARSFFAVPRSYFSIQNAPTSLGEEVVSKPLGEMAIDKDRIIYTSRVEVSNLLRPYPWYLQEALIGGRDLTCVHMLGHNYFYESGFARGTDAIDWRVEINGPSQSTWHPVSHPKLDAWKGSVNRLMNHFKLHFGRLDFILKDDTLLFLECNPNGQFGWLDDPSGLTLHHQFVESASDPRSIVV
jgi:hypothetical protein